jgi:hypothetical protein
MPQNGGGGTSCGDSAAAANLKVRWPMNGWAEHVLRMDPYLAPNTRRLADLIARFFIAFNKCSFFDHEAAALLGVNGDDLRAAKNELLRKGYLQELPSAGRKPAYQLRFARAIRDGETA